MFITLHLRPFIFLLGIGLVFGCFSCVSTKKVSYFQDINLGQSGQIRKMATFIEPVIQPDDILSIQLFSLDPQSTQVTNQGSSLPAAGSSQASPSSSSVPGFLVDKDGEVELVGLGKLKLAGLTTAQARDLIRKRAATLYNDVTIDVRFANFKITVLGEVNRPAVYTMANERVTVFDAIGLAGDLTIFGKRENVMLIRDNNGSKEFFLLDLNSSSLVTSPYFYLKQNDVIYVEPNKAKAASLNAARTQTFAIVGSLLSVLIILITRL